MKKLFTCLVLLTLLLPVTLSVGPTVTDESEVHGR